MPPKVLFDISHLDLDKAIVDQEGIYKVNPHRFEFMMLDGIVHVDRDTGRIVGYRDVTEDEFWVRGHIPGRPIFPGVLMIESAAQLVSYYVMSGCPDKRFLGFGGVTDVKFRGAAVPGDRVVLLGQMMEIRSRRCMGQVQGFVNGAQVFEGRITGMWM
jgi:3-hydroxyacyl-[acyl-carrier-protein] dehydratase